MRNEVIPRRGCYQDRNSRLPSAGGVVGLKALVAQGIKRIFPVRNNAKRESGVLTSEDVWAKVKQIVEITSKNRIP